MQGGFSRQYVEYDHPSIAFYYKVGEIPCASECHACISTNIHALSNDTCVEQIFDELILLDTDVFRNNLVADVEESTGINDL